MYNIKRMFQSYNCALVTKRFHKATDSTAVTQYGSEVELLSQQLGGVDNRQVGPRLYIGVSNPLHKFASPRMLIKSSYILCQAKLADSKGSEYTRKGCNYPIQTPFKPQMVSLDPLSGPQETPLRPQRVLLLVPKKGS